jgi:hypothetical protein
MIVIVRALTLGVPLTVESAPVATGTAYSFVPGTMPSVTAIVVPAGSEMGIEHDPATTLTDVVVPVDAPGAVAT